MNPNPKEAIDNMLREHDKLRREQEALDREFSPLTPEDAAARLAAGPFTIFSISWNATVNPGGNVPVRVFVQNDTGEDKWPLGLTMLVGPSNLAPTIQEMAVWRDPAWPIRSAAFFSVKPGVNEIDMEFTVDPKVQKGGYVLNFVLWNQFGHWSLPATLLDRFCIYLRVE